MSAAIYILHLTGERARLFEQHVLCCDDFAEPVEDFSCSRATALVCLVLVNGQLSHVARARRGVRAGSGLRRLNLTDVLTLTVPLQSTSVIAATRSRFRTTIEARLKAGGMLPPRSSEVLADVVSEAAPETTELLGSLSATRRLLIERLAPEVRRSLAYQKEAVTNALAFAGIHAKPLLNWSPGASSAPSSFLDGLGESRLREDSMVVNDMLHVPGFELVRTLLCGAAVFEAGPVRLTVVLANRQPLEEQLGTDLIYYNETYGSFVMVQYKAMEQEVTEGGVGYRLPDAQLDREIERMNAALEFLASQPEDATCRGFRLCSNPFFLKLCSRVVLRPDDSRMLGGMYLPLDYWRRLAGASTTLGPRGGRRITFQNVGRFLGKDDFVQLVAGAWIGTTAAQSEILEAAMRNTLESGRALALAVRTARPLRTQDELTRTSDDESILGD